MRASWCSLALAITHPSIIQQPPHLFDPSAVSFSPRTNITSISSAPVIIAFLSNSASGRTHTRFIRSTHFLCPGRFLTQQRALPRLRSLADASDRSSTASFDKRTVDCFCFLRSQQRFAQSHRLSNGPPSFDRVASLEPTAHGLWVCEYPACLPTLLPRRPLPNTASRIATLSSACSATSASTTTQRLLPSDLPMTRPPHRPLSLPKSPEVLSGPCHPKHSLVLERSLTPRLSIHLLTIPFVWSCLPLVSST